MDVNLAVSLVCAVLCAASTDGAWTSVEAETMLLAKLLSTYSRDARPVVMSSQSVNVSVEISFVGLEDIDESKNIFTATILLMQMWKDQRLAWNVSSYGGVKTVRLPVKKLWIPDIVPYNTAGMYEGKHRYDEVGHVLSDGTVFWLPMYTITSRCPMDVSNFPFDKQQCQIILGSWVYSSREVQMTFLNTPTPQVDLSLSDAEAAFPFSSHPNWNVNRAVARLRSVKYSCCEDPFTLLTVTVNLSRTSTFYRWLAVGPAAVYGFLVPLLFLIPSRSDGKTTYGSCQASKFEGNETMVRLSFP